MKTAERVYRGSASSVAGRTGGSSPRAAPACRLLGVLLCAASLFACDNRSTEPATIARDHTTQLNSNGVVADVSMTNAAMSWNVVTLQAVSAGTLGPPMVARALAIVHTAMFDAWVAYHPVANGTRLGGALRRPAHEHTVQYKAEAVSVAAYRALVDLYPAQQWRFDAHMRALGYEPYNATRDAHSPAGIGNVAADALLAFRHADGANQLGNLNASGVPYADYTGYTAVNAPYEVLDPNAWQPLRHLNRAGTAEVTQSFLGAQWNRVTPFALQSASEFRPPPPRYFTHGTYRQQAEELLRLSANLTDRHKVIAEYWADGPNTVLPPGHFCLFAQYVSLRDAHGLDDDVVMFFMLGNAMLDASIASWDAKIHYNYVRPITAIRFLKRGQRVRAWAGPGQGSRVIPGEQWRPYQPEWFPTPPFAEYVSGHSTFSAAGAEILSRFTGSDAFGAGVVIDAGDLGVEPGVPAQPVTLAWSTFTDAANEAGLSRRYGGIHFEDGDLAGRAMGRQVAGAVWTRAMELLDGTP